MKFSKDGKVMDFDSAWRSVCRGNQCGEGCPLGEYNFVPGQTCTTWGKENPEEFAKLCGFEIIIEGEVKNCTIKCEYYKALGPYMFQCVRPEQVYCPCDPTGALKEPLSDLVTVKAQEAKADAGKLQIHMVPMQIVRDIAEVRMYGTAKYGGDENNWRKVELMRYVDALLRHTLAFAEDIHSVDEESGIPHYKHAECNLAFISELLKDWKGDADGRAGGETAAAAGE